MRGGRVPRSAGNHFRTHNPLNDPILHPVDYVLIVVFLFATAAIGILSRGKQGSTADYFLSKGNLSGFIGT